VFDRNPSNDQPGFYVFLNTGNGFDSGKQWQGRFFQLPSPPRLACHCLPLTPNDNAINYIYNEDKTKGEYTLQRINYGNNSVRLTYADRNDTHTSYLILKAPVVEPTKAEVSIMGNDSESVVLKA
jgi:hypothetical protein